VIATVIATSEGWQQPARAVGVSLFFKHYFCFYSLSIERK